MSLDPIPQHVNIRKAVTRNARYHGYLGAVELPQFAAVFAETGGDGRNDARHNLELTVEFATDDGGQQFITVTMRAMVTLECQRCLDQVHQVLESVSQLALVHGDEQAQQLSAEYEPLIAIDDVDLWEVAAEELALALPVVAYHPRGECSPPESSEVAVVGDEENRGSSAREANPFNVLSSLLNRDDTEEK